MKRYNDDPVKAKARTMLKETIEETLLKFKRSQDLRVLHFPGYDSMEVLHVYDALGIPRQNVTGLEFDPAVAEHIRKVTPDIKLIEMPLADYLDRNRILSFEVLSLDFTQNYSSGTYTDAVLNNSKIKPNQFVYHVAMQKSRESNKSTGLLKTLAGTFEMCFNDDISAKKFLESERVSQDLREYGFAQILAQLKNKRSDEEKKYIWKRLFGGDFLEVIQNLAYSLRNSPNDKVSEDIEELLRGGEEEINDPEKELELLLKSKNSGIGWATEHILNIYAENRIVRKIMGQITDHIEKNPNSPLSNISYINAIDSFSKTFAGHIVFGMTITNTRLDDITLVDKYSYISERGTPMMGDIAYFQNNKKLASLYEELLEVFSPSRDFQMKDVFYDFHKALRIDKKISRDNQNFRPERDLLLSERVFLGSSAKPILTRGKALELLSQGHSPQSIVGSHRGKTLHQVAAYQAHIRMGTYNEIENKGETTEIKTDLDNRRILVEEGVKLDDMLSRDDALGYLKLGISVEEIHAAYPMNSVPQLNAWQFWLERGKYEDSA